MKEIRKIISFYDSLRSEKLGLALVEVVNIEGSSYRRIGARMLVTSDGRWVGGISGGCLEGDALKKAQRAIHRNKASRVVYDTMDDDARQIGVGLGCQGKIEVIFNPINRDNTNNDIEMLRRASESNDDVYFARIIESESGRVGWCASLDISIPETFAELPFDIIEASLIELKEIGKSFVRFIHGSNGKERVLFSIVKPRLRLLLIGHQYDIEPTVVIANALDWEIGVVGKLSNLTKKCVRMLSQVYGLENLEEVVIETYDAIILMTHDYASDLKILPLVLNSHTGYVGVLGPRKRFERLIEELKLISNDQVFAPVGLDIGAETPEEIAISMVSEIISWQRGRKGVSLRERKSTIHER